MLRLHGLLSGLHSHLLADPRMGGRNAGLLAVIETPDAMAA
ncbi:MAG: hypothetical protein VKI93_08355 [Synechococcus sp.]|nr:hypothetical protein [Synechococcus sp.]